MNKKLIIILVAVGLVIGVPSAVYAYDYLNEYEVNVDFTISSSDLGVVAVTEVETTSQLMDWLSFWDILKGHSAADKSDYYTVFVEITQDSSGASVTDSQYVQVEVGQSMALSYTLFEIEPGDSTLRIYAQSMLTMSIVLDETYDVMIG